MRITACEGSSDVCSVLSSRAERGHMPASANSEAISHHQPLANENLVSSKIQSTENELNGIAEGYLSHNVMSGSFFYSVIYLRTLFYFILAYMFFLSFYPTGPIHIYYGFHFGNFMEFPRMKLGQSLFLEPPFSLFTSIFFKFCYDAFISHLSQCILFSSICFYYYFIEAQVSSNQSQRGSGCRWKGSWGRAGSRGRIIDNQIRIYGVGNFSAKGQYIKKRMNVFS